MRKSVVLLVPVLLAAFIGCTSTETGTGETLTFEQAKQSAHSYVASTPTYMYDGTELQYVGYEECTGNCWVFTFTYTSAHAGYGDRTGQMLAQVLTDHTAVIKVSSGEIESAVLDDQWDIVTQQML